MTRAVVLVGTCCALAGIPGCWYFEPCPDNVGGIKEGEQLETKVIAAHAPVNASDESCGDLGDLAPDTTFTWKAHLGGSAETCDDRTDIQPLSASSGDVSETSSWSIPPKITLPNGCAGSWNLRINDLKPDPQLIGTPDATSPGWVLVRTFTPSADATACPSGLKGSCTDAFVAETTRSEP
jgi:hypothetical protein